MISAYSESLPVAPSTIPGQLAHRACAKASSPVVRRGSLSQTLATGVGPSLLPGLAELPILPEVRPDGRRQGFFNRGCFGGGVGQGEPTNSRIS